MLDVSAAELDAMLGLGWRRFGPVYFRPACEACSACIPVRIEVATFEATRSQRRARKNAAHLRRATGEPLVDPERLALYRRWHASREEKRGWEPSAIDAERYRFDFTFPHPAAREITYRDDEGRLVGVGLVDVVPSGTSAVFFFWDPERAPASLGVAHVVSLVEDARRAGAPYVYLGYLVEACPSLAYKGRYEPQERLEGRPADAEPPRWRRHLPVIRPSPG